MDLFEFVVGVDRPATLMFALLTTGVVVAGTIWARRLSPAIVALAFAGAALGLAGLLFNIRMPHLALCSAAFAAALVSSASARWSVLGLISGLSGVVVALVAVAWLATTRGAMVIVKESPAGASYSEFIELRTNAGLQLALTLAFGLAATALALWHWRRERSALQLGA